MSTIRRLLARRGYGPNPFSHSYYTRCRVAAERLIKTAPIGSYCGLAVLKENSTKNSTIRICLRNENDIVVLKDLPHHDNRLAGSLAIEGEILTEIRGMRHVIWTENIHKADGRSYTVVLEVPYCTGGSLRERMYGSSFFSPISLSEKINAALSSAVGISQIHKNDIVHRDIKPANIFLYYDKITDGWQVLVGDLGAAVRGATIDAPFQASLPYASPELIQKNDFSEMSDVWAWAVTMWEFVTGKHPFLEIFHDRQRKDIAKSLRHKKLDLWGGKLTWLRDILVMGLAFSPDDRPKMDEIIKMFQPHVDVGLSIEIMQRTEKKIQLDSGVLDYVLSTEYGWPKNDRIIIGGTTKIFKQIRDIERIFSLTRLVEGSSIRAYSVEPGLEALNLLDRYLGDIEDPMSTIAAFSVSADEKLCSRALDIPIPREWVFELIKAKLITLHKLIVNTGRIDFLSLGAKALRMLKILKIDELVFYDPYIASNLASLSVMCKNNDIALTALRLALSKYPESPNVLEAVFFFMKANNDHEEAAVKALLIAKLSHEDAGQFVYWIGESIISYLDAEKFELADEVMQDVPEDVYLSSFILLLCKILTAYLLRGEKIEEYWSVIKPHVLSYESGTPPRVALMARVAAIYGETAFAKRTSLVMLSDPRIDLPVFLHLRPQFEKMSELP